MKSFTKIFVLMISLLCFFITPGFADLPFPIPPIPHDDNLTYFTAVIGRTADDEWTLLRLNLDGSLKVGTLTAEIIGSISSVLIIDYPVWEAQPQQIFNTLNWTLGQNQLGSYTDTLPILNGYSFYLEYITIIRTDAIVDYYNLAFYTGTNFVLGGEVSPASPQAIFSPPIPIYLNSSLTYTLHITNKSSDSQSFKIGLVFGIRKKL